MNQHHDKPSVGHFNGQPDNRKSRVTDRSGDSARGESLTQATAAMFERTLESAAGTGTRYTARQDHPWTKPEIDARYTLPDRALGEHSPDVPLVMAEFYVMPEQNPAKPYALPLASERTPMAPVEIQF